MAKGLPGDVKGLLNQAKQMQNQLEQVHSQAQEYSEEGQSGGGMIKVIAKGDNTIQSITIDPQVIDPSDVDMLQDMIIAACNDALSNVQTKVQSELTKITGGMSIPGLF